MLVSAPRVAPGRQAGAQVRESVPGGSRLGVEGWHLRDLEVIDARVRPARRVGVALQDEETELSATGVESALHTDGILQNRRARTGARGAMHAQAAEQKAERVSWPAFRLHHHVAMLMPLEVQHRLRFAPRHGPHLLVDGGYVHSGKAAHVDLVPVAQKHGDVHRRGGADVPAEFEGVGLGDVPSVSTRVSEEIHIPELETYNEVFGAREFERVRVSGQVVRRGAVGCGGVLAIELHEAVAELVLYNTSRNTGNPEVMITRHRDEGFCLGCQRQFVKQLGRNITSLVIEIVTEDAPEVDLVRADQLVDYPSHAVENLEAISIRAAYTASRRETWVGEEDAGNSASQGRQPQMQLLAVHLDRSALRRNMHEL
mmetsp:Transcript_25410/g.70762  ORF Transcript_25410/g.70762 Transcript_25410/m.70762 type:complete len:371 (+) Transcript_25410:416-1528(+)